MRPGEGEDVGAEGIADDEHRQRARRIGVGEDLLEIGGDRLRLARLPERLERADADDVDVLPGHPFADRLVEILPAAVARIDDRERARLPLGRQVDDLRRVGVGERRRERRERVDGERADEGKDRKVHLASTPSLPPETRLVTSSRTPGKASPPGPAMYCGAHTGSNFCLKAFRPSK